MAGSPPASRSPYLVYARKVTGGFRFGTLSRNRARGPPGPPRPAAMRSDPPRREAAAHRALRYRAGLEELQQVVRPARLVADAGGGQAAEGLAAHDGAGGP